MHLEHRPLLFSTITHHASVTQCLGSIGGHVWYLGVAKPSILDSKENKNDPEKSLAQSHCGHFYVPPAVDNVRVFRVAGPKFLKLNRGTWHAGPLFKGDFMDFYNLELSNTNVSFSSFFFYSWSSLWMHYGASAEPLIKLLLYFWNFGSMFLVLEVKVKAGFVEWHGLGIWGFNLHQTYWNFNLYSSALCKCGLATSLVLFHKKSKELNIWITEEYKGIISEEHSLKLGWC